jgi:hypothetical protein
LGRIVTSPALYAGWAAFVLIALPIAYDGDPYIYGFVTLGLLVAVLAETLSLTARAIIIVSIVAACAAATLALRVLGTFNWA